MLVTRSLVACITAILFIITSYLTPGYADVNVDLKTQIFSNLKSGETAFHNQNYPLAEQTFKFVTQKSKELGQTKLFGYASSFLGFSQVYLDKEADAALALEQAEPYVNDPTFPAAKMINLLAYMEFYSRKGDTATERKYIQATMSQPDNYLQSVSMSKDSFLGSIQRNQLLEKAVSELSIPSQAEDYLGDSLLSGKVMRWSDNKKVIKVYISPGNQIQGWNPAYIENFKKACLVWQGALGNTIQFEFVETPDEPVDTVVTWYMDRNVRAATTDNEINGNKLVKADIAFHLIDNSNQLFVPRSIYKTSLHEIGHLLGIHGHSKNPNDIMFPASTFAVKPSARDIATAVKLYSLPAQITTPENQTLSQYRAELIAKGKRPAKLIEH